ncbi:uncharacterized protein LOC131007892 [Salvia miltiorrhiza]|uniref:uncharacterized protein LOC131007892 n=1 Tax=Salvia miltiorrhiza TaxID=226208 RepID=UPI0025AC2020|nr:uncharacterized protein LOC131007892 [Salvia miltiorrhiza]
MFMDTAAGGSLLKKGSSEAMEIIESMATTSYQWPSERVQLKKVTAASSSDLMALILTQLAEMNLKINAMTVGDSEPAVEIPTGVEDVNYINGRNYGNFQHGQQSGYNNGQQLHHGGRPHPNLAYGNPNNALQAPPGFSEGAMTAKDESAQLIEKKSEEVTVEKERMKERLSKFLEIFKKVNINIPLVEMPQYAKFLKDIVSRKKKLGEFETHFGRSLCDLRASINLMPLSVFQQLAIGELKPTSIRLQMADRSVTYLRGIVENVLVKVGDFILPAYFVVLDIEDDNKIPLILGRPFLATGRALIDVENGELTLRLHDESQTFYVYEPYRIHKDEVPKKAKDPGMDPGDRKLKGGILAGKSGAGGSCSQHYITTLNEDLLILIYA